MTQDTTGPGHPEPGPDNFSFEGYLEGNSTFPTFEHTAFLDQKSGAELGAIDEDLNSLARQLEAVDKQIRARVESSVNSLVDSMLDRLKAQKEELEEELERFTVRREELRKKIIGTSITLVFQVKTPEELGSVTREATRQFHKENPGYKDASESDLDYITARSRYSLTAQIAHFCIHVRLPNGDEKPPPNRAGADLLLRKLIASETMRLMESVGNGLSASRDWADNIDAGFPGGSPDVEEVGMAEADPQDGPVMERATLDDDHGQAERLV